uniref:Uncharacterized protein n=1 Tax=Arundo donax TaxID=35708 RepID=A0A0A9C347_ARUDO
MISAPPPLPLILGNMTCHLSPQTFCSFR